MVDFTIPEECDFNKIIQGDFGLPAGLGSGFGRNDWGMKVSCSCTPEFMGIGFVINAPSELIYPTDNSGNEGNVLPLTGVIQREAHSGLNLGRLPEAIVFVIVDTKTPTFSFGQIPPSRNKALKKPIPRPFPPEKGIIIGKPFTLNLLEICHIPLYETQFIVYATVGPFKSNVLTINVTQRK